MIYDINFLFGETGVIPVRARRREVHMAVHLIKRHNLRQAIG